MSAVDEVDQLIERFHQVQGEFVKGNPEPVKELWSHAEDVTLNNPLSPTARGWDEVANTIERAAAPSLPSRGLPQAARPPPDESDCKSPRQGLAADGFRSAGGEG